MSYISCLLRALFTLIIQYVFYLILYLIRMLHYSEMANLTKPSIAINLVKMILFLSLGVFFLASRKHESMVNDEVARNCGVYFNNKLSLYQKQTQLVCLVMAFVGAVSSLINAVNFLIFYIRTRKKLTSTQDYLQYTPNRLRINFILDFLQSICILNIFSRSVEQFREFSVCGISQITVPIVSIVISGTVIPILLGTILMLFKILALMNKKTQTLQEFTLDSDQSSLRQNLFFNKTGYVKQLLKMQSCSRRSTQLRNSTIKGLPSGYKKNDFSPTREIIYKLLGGNKTSQKSNAQQNEFDNFQVQIVKPTQAKIQKQDLVSIQIRDFNPNELHINPKQYNACPNNDNLEDITTTINVLQFAFGQEELKKSQQDKSSDEEQVKKNPTKKTKKQENVNVSKQKNKKPRQINVQEELKQKFNLTPNIQARKKHQKRKNWQNIDENGHYYQVNVDRIKNKTKLLGSMKLSDNIDEIDPTVINAMYSRRQWVQKKKRVAKKHEKNVQEYLRNLSKLRKEEMLYESDGSCDSQDLQKNKFQKEQPQYSSSEEDNQESQKIQQVQAQKEQQIKKDQQAEGKDNQKRKKTKNLKPQLYLHMRKKKHPISENHLKLYEDDDEFYDDIDDLQGSQENVEERIILSAEIDKIYDKGLTKEQSSERHKLQEKIHLRNKQLNTNEAERLRFICKKYIESKQQIEGNNTNKKIPVVFENQAQNETVKQKKSVISKQN